MPDSRTAGEMPFIVSIDLDKVTPDTRKLIRSHVMVGKNRGRILGTTRKKRKPAASTTEPPVVIGEHPLPADEATAGLQQPHFQHDIPQKVGSELSLIRFADAVDPSTVAVVMQFSTVAKRALFPLEHCLCFDMDSRKWIEPLSFDALYLHTMVFSTQAYFDCLSGRHKGQQSSWGSSHFTKAVRLLRERINLGEYEVQVSSMTISVILCLAVHAYIMGDLTAAGHHMAAIRTIIDLRGGVDAVRGNPKLLIEILRFDIGLSLHRGSQPFLFCNTTVPLSSCSAAPIPCPNRALTPGIDDRPQRCVNKYLTGLDSELMQTWTALEDFSLQINLAADTKTKLPKEIMLDTMASVMYRLLHMNFEAGSLDEAIRLSLLAFCSSIFLQWRDFKLPYMHLPVVYKDCLLNASFLDAPPQLWLWLLMIGSVAVWEEGDSPWIIPWLQSNADACEVTSWSDMQGVLRGSLWIGLVHDRPAERIFEYCCHCVS